jgi:hypothetical protein
VDLSAVIFVVLAVAWAVYLIPKALKHHDELASDRLVEGHSDKVRILSRTGKGGAPEVVEVEVEHVDTVEKVVTAPRPLAQPPATRAAARKAAQRRRRVLSALVVMTLVVAGLAGFAVVPRWATAIPGALVVLFLVVARQSVRRAQARRTSVVDQPREARVDGSPAPATAPTTAAASQDLVDLLAEDTAALQRQDLEAALADDGSLWDPLPMTLPTYVNKARARRTVRTIELTGINSSGHDEADTALAREAEESAQESARPAGDAEATPRKAAGA